MVFLTRDESVQEILRLVGNIANTKVTVLINGESGTGKEVLSRYIHQLSDRSRYDFVAINCAAMPEGLLESELFGYEKGAFTGAHQSKPGKFELADRGTFLLDEISELPLKLQGKLLRVIQEGEVQRLGARQPRKINIRLIGTTNRDLSLMVQQGLFREDLFYRLNVIPLTLPPLRSRPKDIILLSEFYLEKFAKESGRSNMNLSSDARKKMLSWGWPGNVRELCNVLQRSILLAPSTCELTDDLIRLDTSLGDKKETLLAAGMSLREAESLLIQKTLALTNQNKSKAADILGINVRTLRNKLKEFTLDGGLK